MGPTDIKIYKGIKYFITFSPEGDPFISITKNRNYSEKELIIPSYIDGIPVKTIGYNAFAESEIEKLVVPDTIVSIGDSAFSHCVKLTDVTFGNGLRVISDFAFTSTSLKSFKAPPSLSTIGYRAFDKSALEDIELNDGLHFLRAFAFTKNPISKIIIPDSVFACDEGVFDHCSQLKSIHIGENVKTLFHSNAPFLGCNSLSKISVSDKNNSLFTNNGLLYEIVGEYIYLLRVPSQINKPEIIVDKRASYAAQHAFNAVVPPDGISVFPIKIPNPSFEERFANSFFTIEISNIPKAKLFCPTGSPVYNAAKHRDFPVANIGSQMEAFFNETETCVDLNTDIDSELECR